MTYTTRMAALAGIKTRVVQLAALGIPQERIALELGIDRSLLSRYLRGLRKPPEGFMERLEATLDRLEAAERAADEARARVLAEAGPEGAA